MPCTLSFSLGCEGLGGTAGRAGQHRAQARVRSPRVHVSHAGRAQHEAVPNPGRGGAGAYAGSGTGVTDGLEVRENAILQYKMAALKPTKQANQHANQHGVNDPSAT